MLLTEAAYLAAAAKTAAEAAADVAAADQMFGWWQPDGGGVAGAFLQAPRHPPILSLMSGDALEALAERVPDLPPVGVDGRMVDAVVAAWRGRAVELSERSRVRLYRLGHLRSPTLPSGRARLATPADRDLLVTWYEQLMAAFPDDPSELTYVVDQLLRHDAVGGRRSSVSSRSSTG